MSVPAAAMEGDTMKKTLNQSDYMKKLLRIPDYLSSTTNMHFRQMIEEKKLGFINSSNLEVIRQICLLMHQMAILKLEDALWLTYLESGTGKLIPNKFNIKVWPLDMKTIMNESGLPVDKDDDDDDRNNDRLFVNWIQDYYLYTLNRMQEEFQEELFQKKKQLSISYSHTIDRSLYEFTSAHLQSIDSMYEYRKNLVKLNYREQILEHSFYALQPSLTQITKVKYIIKYKYIDEETRQELQWIKRGRGGNSSSSDENQKVLSSTIQSIANGDLREHLATEHHRILERYNNEMNKLLVNTIESKLAQSEKEHYREIQMIYRHQNTLPADQQITKDMTDIIDGYYALITEKLQLTYANKSIVPTQ